MSWLLLPSRLVSIAGFEIAAEGENIVLVVVVVVVVVNCSSKLFTGVFKFVPRSVKLTGVLPSEFEDDEEEESDTVLCLTVVNAVDWNGLLEPCLTKCTAP